MLGVGGVGLFCGRVHPQTRGTKGNQGEQGEQGEPRGTKGNKGNKGTQGEPRGTQGNQGNPRKTQGNPLQSTKEIPSNQWEYLQSIGFLSKQGKYFTVKWKRKAVASDGG